MLTVLRQIFVILSRRKRRVRGNKVPARILSSSNIAHQHYNKNKRNCDQDSDLQVTLKHSLRVLFWLTVNGFWWGRFWRDHIATDNHLVLSNSYNRALNVKNYIVVLKKRVAKDVAISTVKNQKLAFKVIMVFFKQ